MSRPTPALRVIPLGGLGEIGMNCLALEQRDEIIIVDCGVTFPNESLGADIIHPRFDWLLENRSKLRGLVITHGHEDHIGAVPYLLDDVDLPVFAPPHALSLIRLRLAEWRFDLDALRLVTTFPGQRFRVGSFELEPIRVAHSIADATALAIWTDAGVVVHTGDFKLDEHPADGERTDEARLIELGDEGVRLLLSDSTNVDSPGTAASEEVVGDELERVVREAKNRVIVGIFASNVQRLLHLGEIARRTGRRIVLLGRSVLNHVRVATSVGRLRWPSDLVVSPEAGQAMPRKEVLVIASGTQAETNAALWRLASGDHPKLKVDEGDTVVFSSRIIPGNDRAVFDLFAVFLRRGIDVLSRVTHPRVHASGHAHREELTRMMEMVRPDVFIPVHGTLHHLTRHAGLARSIGVGEVLVAENGEVVELGAVEGPRRVGRVTSGRVHTIEGVPIPEDVLRERAQLGQRGVVNIVLAIGERGQLVGPPALTSHGVLGPLDGDVLVRAGRAAEAAAVTALSDRGPLDEGALDGVRLA
ncbi:MAG: ribonuclease J, partial [Polyangiaceae bacterium]